MAPVNGVSRLARRVFARDAWRLLTLPRSRFDYAGEVGDGTGSSTITAPLFWMARTFPEAPPALWKKNPDSGLADQEEPVRDHPLLRLLERPNLIAEGANRPAYSGVVLWMATITDWLVNGNAYWIILRNNAGVPSELWFTPSWMIEPRGNPEDLSVFVDHYRYTVDGQQSKIRPDQVVHFRFGLDPLNERLGMSPLKSVLREVFTDDEAANFTASILRNMGVPGVVISPDAEGVSISPEAAELHKENFMAKFSGDQRGEPMVFTAKTKIQQFGFSPEQLLLRELRRIPEERTTAVMGVPAIVAGLGAGLDRSTFTNMAEAREAAYESGIIPIQRILAEDVRWQLLSLFEADPFQWRFGFDLTKVRVLQEDLYRQMQRHDLAVRGGWEMVSEARRAAGLPVDDNRDDVFLRQASMNVMRASTFAAPARGAATQNGSSNGHAQTSELAFAVADEVARRLEAERLLTEGA
jgi:HK97 family phage portal protein